MATHRLPILGGAMPDSSGEVYYEPFALSAVEDLYDVLVAIFEDGTTKTGLGGSFEVPQNYNAAPKIIVVWTANAITDDVEWDVDLRAVGGDDIESLDPSTHQESINVNDTAPSAVFERLEVSLAFTAATFAAGDTVLWELSRDKSDAGDTMSADAIVFDVLFEYTD